MACSSTPTLADFSMLLWENLVNIEQQPTLDISTVLAAYKIHFPSEYEWMNGCIKTYGKLACDETAIYAGILTLISAISGSTFYVDVSNGKERLINLYVHIIGEPGEHVIAINYHLVNKILTLPHGRDNVTCLRFYIKL
ncbi:unnamed protein product [Rotaria sp. Silwood2]|nr:unnamed protein product [Rotaria sp. Silwood2]CAF4257539.1 unnamed protein product [Rotaria sp. Silwood2]